MKLTHLATAAAAVALMGGVAWAQQPVNPAPGSNDPAATPPPAESQTPPPADTSAAPPPPAPAASTYGQSASVAAPTVLTNGPVPDTKENRAKYGKPMSNAGKRSAAKGN